ncbi:MAG: sulfurtransferase TusC, partial [Halioglobus sp.]|nr:sulfurtransferase TusC [Halioglobus sp.]
MQKRVLLIIRHSPYGSGLARAGVDFALACGAFEQNITLLFTGPGVLQLKDQQSGSALGLKDIGKQLASLPLYDIASVCVDADAGARYALDCNSS